MHITVSSMRLDALIAAVFHMGRADAAKCVTRELVKHNHLIETRPDARVQARDLISVRSFGRFRIESEPGLTKKGRLGLSVRKFH